VQELLPMSQAIRLLRAGLSSSDSANLPRRRLTLEKGALNVMAASYPGGAVAGLKAYAVSPAGISFVVALWDHNDGRLLALIEADQLGRVRTGAASGVATDLLARPEASILTVIGAGRQARTQIEAVAAVRKLTEIRLVRRDWSAALSSAEELSKSLELNVKAHRDVREAVRSSDIVSTITTSATPVLEGAWLPEGCHINAAGSNDIKRREVNSDVVIRAAVVAVDCLEQAKMEAGDLAVPIGDGLLSWASVVELGQLLRRSKPGRQSTADITFFKSIGIALEDVAVARYIYDRAVAEGRGEVTTFGDR
jgi:alanine dehydrogenase